MTTDRCRVDDHLHGCQFYGTGCALLHLGEVGPLDVGGADLLGVGDVLGGDQQDGPVAVPDRRVIELTQVLKTSG